MLVSILQEEVPVAGRTEVLVTFLDTVTFKQRTPGGLEGKITIPDDFNDPLEDLKDYM